MNGSVGRKREKSSERRTMESLAEILSGHLNIPTDPFTMFEPRHQEMCDLYVAQKRRATDFEALKL